MITHSSFKALWWLRNPHLQTIWPVLANRSSHRGYAEKLTLSDGDFVDLEWFDAEGPLVIVLHGLEGSIHSPYAVALTKALFKQNYQVLFMHFRGCGETFNTADRSYHSGETSDLDEVLSYAKQRTGKNVSAAVGYSLGGNVLLKYLGEQGKHSPITAAIAVSVPYLLGDAARRMNQGLSKIYENYLLTKLRKSYLEKFRLRKSPLNVKVSALRSFEAFDDQITAPLNGFKSGDEYYRLSSSRQYIKNIATPTLLVHAKDDPFMFSSTVPTEADLSSSVTLELTERGGHVGFISGTFMPKRWLEGRILAYLKASGL